MIRQVLGLVRVACLFIWPPDIYVRTRVDHAGADLLTEREAEVEVMEPIRLGPVFDVRDQSEPTEELLLAAANQLDEYRKHTHFNTPRHEYLAGLSHQLRDRATLFAQNR